ncbi:hypothetical protein PoB_006857600 [Plakobranchus ocellatus]|uniref:Uncharacterized protein n=1 Tax=Plakobranchus ocellatus TaxID=259542 RepID=A0AAV4DD53_9GAST|nr:hypothetical protein PoB_006857600 [Plakobranchus ocellatus]
MVFNEIFKVFVRVWPLLELDLQLFPAPEISTKSGLLCNKISKVTSLTAAYQRDSVSQAQTNAAFQQQLTQLLQDNQQLTLNNNRLTQELQRLTNQVQTLAAQCSAGCGSPSNTPAVTTNPTSGPTTAPVTVPPAPTINPARLAKIESDILALDNRFQQQNADLNALDQIVNANHTQEIRNAALELRSHDLRIQKNERDINTVTQALQQFNTLTVPNLQASVNTLNQDSQALKNLTARLQAAQQILLNDTLFMKLDVAQLQKDFQASQNVQGQHRQAIDQLNLNLIGALLATYPQLNTVQANVNSILSGNPSGTTSQPGTTGSVIIPPTLKPPVVGPSSSTTTAKASTAGIIVPPTLRPPGPG